VDSGSTIFFWNNSTSTFAGLTLSGPGNSEGRSALRFGNAAVLNGPVTLSANSTIASGNGESATMTGNVSATGVNTLTVGLDPDTGGNMLLSGSLSDGSGTLSLVKDTAGTLTLTGANTYSGDTTVNQGILSLGTINPNNETSTVSIADSAATLNLAFTGNDFAGKLFIGATQQPAGVYGNIDSVPPVIGIAQITGPGTLTVGAGYASWQAVNGTSQAFDGDHDSDGVPNGVEYFLGGPNGNTTGFTPLPSVVNNAGTLSVTWEKGPGYTGTYNQGFVVETSDTLTDPWTVEPAPPTPGAHVSFPTANTVRYTFPSPLDPKKFVRLKVTESP
jgi:autotransporter-associated beta strand protein